MSKNKITPEQQKFIDLLDIDRILKETPNKNKLKITLKKDPIKSSGVYATKPIKKNEVIAYYKVKVFNYDKYESPTGNMYTFNIYTKNGNESKTFIGDIDLDSFPLPENNITFWGPFLNEPSKGQKANAEVDNNIKENYKNRKRVKEGQTLIYKIVAKRNIKTGEELMWYYGEDYIRDYEVGDE